MNARTCDDAPVRSARWLLVELLASPSCDDAAVPIAEAICDKACTCGEEPAPTCMIRTGGRSLYYLEPARQNCETAVELNAIDPTIVERCRRALAGAVIEECELVLPADCAPLVVPGGDAARLR